MKALILPAFLALTFSSAVLAGPTCTEADPSTWMPQDSMKQQILEQGYRIKKFKQTDGNCYEIYGYDSENRRVEIYFNPVTGEAVKTKIED